LFSLGLVGDIASIVDPANPIRLISVSGLSLGEELRSASLLALPLGFGVSLATTSVQTYINRRVPIRYQGRTLALQSAVGNGAAVAPLLVLGATASWFGTDKVLLVSPFLLLMLGSALLHLSFRFAAWAPPSYLEEVESFWEEPEPNQEET
jgi:MFS family permease